MKSALALRLQAFTRLSGDDCTALDLISRQSVKRIDARCDIVSEGDKPSVMRLVTDGWACRYKTTCDGRRQIVGFFVPGDFCDLNIYILRRMDHSIGAITPVRVAELTPRQVDELTLGRPRITQGLWWSDLVTASIQREWLLNIGQRNAFERVGHLLLELYFRLHCVDLTSGDGCDFPLTQNDLADATGLTPVHVNRTLQDLRGRGLIALDRRRLRVLDFSALMNASGFSLDYLHLDREGQHLAANA